jgi:uncharacterized protein (TIGR03437 family)
VLPALALSCQGSAAGAEIRVESLSPFGVWPGSVSGRVLGVNPLEYRVAALIFVSGLGHFSKPSCADPTSPLGADSRFSIALTTGGVDETATRIVLLAVPAGMRVECYRNVAGIPEELERASVATAVITRPNPRERSVEFSGETFLVKSSASPVGPGPSPFSDTADNVFVDPDGRLHLKITNRAGRWECAEVFTQRFVGYGRFTFTIDTPRSLDRNVVFGAFTWADGERISGEVDALEIGWFGRPPDSVNAQAAVQPFDVPGNLRRFALPEGAPTTHILEWTPGRIVFRSVGADGSPIHEWVYSGSAPRIASPELRFRFNLWLFNGQSPSDRNEAEVVVRSFSFVPLRPSGLIPHGLVNAAGSAPAVSPGSLFVLYGEGLVGAPVSAPAIPLPTALEGASVLLNGYPAPLLHAEPARIVGQVPYLAGPGNGVATIRTPSGVAGAIPLVVAPAAPGLFQSEGNACVAQNADGTANSRSRPARAGETIVAYGTGIGNVDNPVETGGMAPPWPLSRPVLGASMTIGGIESKAAFIGLAPGWVGLVQANAVVPRELPPGLWGVRLWVGGAPSNTCSVSVADPL